MASSYPPRTPLDVAMRNDLTLFQSRVRSVAFAVFGPDNLWVTSCPVSAEHYGYHEAVIVQRIGIPLSLAVCSRVDSQKQVYGTYLFGVKNEEIFPPLVSPPLATFLHKSILAYCEALLSLSKIPVDP